MHRLKACQRILLAVFSCVAAVCFSAQITLVDGTQIQAESVKFKDSMAEVLVDGETLELGRNDIRNISFSARKQEDAVLSTDTADLPALMQRARQILSTHPDSASIIVKRESEYRYNQDGTNIFRYRGVTFIAKKEALGAGRVSLSFDPNRERIRIIHARAFAPDGRIFSITPDMIKITKEVSGGVHFDQNENLSFTIPQADIGFLVDVCYEIDEYNPFDKNLFQGRASFQSFSPIGQASLRVVVPEDKEIFFVSPRFSDDRSKPLITEESGNRIYTWEVTDAEPLIPEPMMPPFRDVVPMVFFSLQKDWTYMFSRMKPMFERRFELTDDVKKKVDEIVEGATDLQEKISRLYLFCQKEIRYVSIKGNLASNQVGRPASETLKNRYGDCTDKAMLLATMLSHIGVEAYPVGVLTNDAGKSVRDLPIFDTNHAITEVHLDGRIFYLDSTATDYRYPYFRPDNHDVSAENAMLGTIKHIPLPPPEDNAIEMNRNITLFEDGSMKIEFESIQNGSAEASFRQSARSFKPDEYEKQIRASIAALTADYSLELATHTDPLDFSGPFKTRSVYTLNRYAPRSGSYMIFEIPHFKLSFSEVSLEKRKYDIVYTTSRLRSEVINIVLPEGFIVKYLPPPLRVQSSYVEFELIYDLRGDSIKVSRKLAFPRREVPVADYSTFKEQLEKISRSSEERIFLEQVTNREGM